MIKFKEIEVIGFGSIKGPFKYRLDKKGINIISGKNGSGKTTWLSAFSWCLFGKTLKGGSSITMWEHLRDKGYKGAKVTNTFQANGKECIVIRCKDYKGKIENIKGASKLFLYIDGKYQEKLRNVKDVQDKIIELLGMSFKLFKNSILFGQKVTRLLSEKGDEQKRIFDEAFATGFINQAKIDAKNELDKLYSESSSLAVEVNQLEDKLSELNNKEEELRELQKNFTIEKQENLKSIREEIKTKKEKIKEVKNQIKEKKEFKAKRVEVENKLIELFKKIDSLKDEENEHFKLDLHIDGQKSEIESLMVKLKKEQAKSLNKVKKCDKCGSVLNKEQAKKQKKETQKNIKDYKKEIETLQSKLNGDELRLSELQSSIDNLESLKKEKRDLSNKLDNVNRHIDKLPSKDYLKSLKEDLSNTKERLKLEKGREFSYDFTKLHKERDVIKNKLKKLEPDVKKLDKKIKVHEWVISDALSNKGLKAYIFKNMITNINKMLRYYDRHLGFQVKFEIDLDSGNKSFGASIYKEGGQVSYDDLSGGQQQLVDVSLAFAVNDVYNEVNPVNILGLDELFESLDESNIAIVSDILYKKSQNLAIHLITHRKEFISSRVVNKIEMVNSSGISSVV
jgi:DNA repair exonuclease SbcCD ATPase subunit